LGGAHPSKQLSILLSSLNPILESNVLAPFFMRMLRGFDF
jgi:hypothetical protein